MNNVEREKLIESVGVDATNRIETLQHQIEELEKFLDIIPIYQTVGWNYQKATRSQTLELPCIE